MRIDTTSEQSYYARHGMVTDPGPYAARLDGLPAGFRALRDVVQGLMLHIYWLERYGVEVSDARKKEPNFRAIPTHLARLDELTSAPLSQALPREGRLIGNCRNFSTMLCAMLRHQGIPARARCGFATYFMPDHFEDHWVCEVWDSTEARWRLVDAQLDTLQVEILKADFDPLDVPREKFIVGGRAWQMIRAGEANPDHFGIFHMKGWAFVRGNLIRDFMALNKIELLPWDQWGFILPDPDAATAEVSLMDRLAALSADAASCFEEIRTVYEQETQLHPAPGWTATTPPAWAP